MFGMAIYAFALLVQPLIGPLLGRGWESAEIFGLAPDPTAVGTLGLLVAAERVRWWLLTIPALWCAVTGLTLWTMGAPDAFVSPLAGAITLGLAVWKTVSPPRGSDRADSGEPIRTASTPPAAAAPGGRDRRGRRG
jgi:hypothetical protein